MLANTGPKHIVRWCLTPQECQLDTFVLGQSSDLDQGVDCTAPELVLLGGVFMCLADVVEEPRLASPLSVKPFLLLGSVHLGG